MSDWRTKGYHPEHRHPWASANRGRTAGRPRRRGRLLSLESNARQSPTSQVSANGLPAVTEPGRNNAQCLTANVTESVTSTAAATRHREDAMLCVQLRSLRTRHSADSATHYCTMYPACCQARADVLHLLRSGKHPDTSARLLQVFRDRGFRIGDTPPP